MRAGGAHFESWKAKTISWSPLDSSSELQRREAASSGSASCDSSMTFCTWPRRSRISRGCRLIVCGRITVSSSGFSARSAPRMAAACVPVAPEVKMWLSERTRA